MAANVTRSKVGWALWLTAAAGFLIISLNLGIRQTLGLFLSPITTDLSMTREQFALAMAIQNLLWGMFTPLLGAIADKYGSLRVILLGTVVYGLGLWAMAHAETLLIFNLSAGVMLGFALAGTGFGVVLGAVGRRAPVEHRSLALGIASAGGSFGQFYMAPVSQELITGVGWAGALTYLALIILLVLPLSFLLVRQPPAAENERPTTEDERKDPTADQTGGHGLKEAWGEAYANRSYWLLTTGFFVCGFQVTFITIHFPAYLQDLNLDITLAAKAIALIGLFNIIGTYACGVLGGKFPKKWVLTWLYVLRALLIGCLLLAPKTELTILVFAAVMGLLWLGTVPLTSGLIATLFGVRYLSTLFGVVFFGHQVGSFSGVWLGGYLYDLTGSYDPVWLISIALGLIAAALHAPIREAPAGRIPAPA